MENSINILDLIMVELKPWLETLNWSVNPARPDWVTIIYNGLINNNRIGGLPPDMYIFITIEGKDITIYGTVSPKTEAGAFKTKFIHISLGSPNIMNDIEGAIVKSIDNLEEIINTHEQYSFE
jgi:hypothetical protein